VTSDRWWAYNHLPVKRRQICWSQLVEIEFGTKLELRGFDEERGAGGSPAHDEVTGDFRERAIDIARTVYAPGSVQCRARA
jgi:hypothetical protein